MSPFPLFLRPGGVGLSVTVRAAAGGRTSDPGIRGGGLVLPDFCGGRQKRQVVICEFEAAGCCGGSRDCVMTEARPSVRCSVDSFAVGIRAAFSSSGVGVGRLGDVPGVQAQRRQENRVAFYRFPGSVPV